MVGGAVEATKPKLFKNTNNNISTTQHDQIHLWIFDEQNQRELIKFALDIGTEQFLLPKSTVEKVHGEKMVESIISTNYLRLLDFKTFKKEIEMPLFIRIKE